VKVKKATEKILEQITSTLEVGRLRQVVEHLEQELRLSLKDVRALTLDSGHLVFPSTLSLDGLALLALLKDAQNRLGLLHGSTRGVLIMSKIETAPASTDFDYSSDRVRSILALSERVDQKGGDLAF
jgi:hypothetical protein